MSERLPLVAEREGRPDHSDVSITGNGTSCQQGPWASTTLPPRSSQLRPAGIRHPTIQGRDIDTATRRETTHASPTPGVENFRRSLRSTSLQRVGEDYELGAT